MFNNITLIKDGFQNSHGVTSSNNKMFDEQGLWQNINLWVSKNIFHKHLQYVGMFIYPGIKFLHNIVLRCKKRVYQKHAKQIGSRNHAHKKPIMITQNNELCQVTIINEKSKQRDARKDGTCKVFND